VFFELLLRSQWENTKSTYKGITLLVRRGQVFTCQQQLANDLGLTKRQVQNALDRFKLDEQIDIQKISNKGCLITLNNYDKWQGDAEKTGADAGSETGAVKCAVQPLSGKAWPNIDSSVKCAVARADAVTESNKLNKLDINTPLTPHLAFKIFWAYYPKKSSKKPAQAKFIKLCGNNPNEILAQCLNNMAARYEHDVENWAKGNQFCLHPSTYLNQARYEDEITSQENPNEITSQTSKQSHQRVRTAGTTQSAREAIEAIRNNARDSGTCGSVVGEPRQNV
jgi:biotin operon repressor